MKIKGSLLIFMISLMKIKIETQPSSCEPRNLLRLAGKARDSYPYLTPDFPSRKDAVAFGGPPLRFPSKDDSSICAMAAR
jgi:hypothetical protein